MVQVSYSSSFILQDDSFPKETRGRAGFEVK
jgi:hypothetical protein